MSFDKEAFDVCKILKNKSETVEISKIIHTLCTYNEKQTGPDRSHFGYLAKQLNCQFYGYLFVNENVSLYEPTSPIPMIPLTSEEKSFLERGHSTLTCFIDACLRDMNSESSTVSNYLNPYTRYREIPQIMGESLLKKDEIESCSNSFKRSSVYQSLINSDSWDNIKKIPVKQLQIIVEALTKQVILNPLDIVSTEIKDWRMRFIQPQVQTSDLLLHAALQLVALREMLSIACQLLFTSTIGGDLIVLNNDNIINIEKNQSNVIHQYMTVLIQNMLFLPYSNLLGDIVLIDCIPSVNDHIHNIGRIQAATISMNREEGETTKLSFKILDEDLNPIHYLTNMKCNQK